MASTVLVIGSGAREHAVAYTLLKGTAVDTVYCAPGNPGMASDGIRTVLLDESDHAAIIDFIRANSIDWVFVGPEGPLMEGITDDLQEAGIAVFGPSRAAAQIEGSKTFAKQLMHRHNIPTAAYAAFASFEKASAYIEKHGAPVVIKADGLAAGKGVTVAMDTDTALQALHDIFVGNKFGSAGSSVVIEDFLEGEEFSLMSFVSGNRFWTMPVSQDHKRAYDDDEGPNTGGMGAYCPVPQISGDIVDTAVDRIIHPAVEGMASEGIPFTGVLYAGLIATDEGPKVIEFNARFGDPETEVILPRLTSDLGAGIEAVLNGKDLGFTWRDDGTETLGVILASEGYPGNTRTGAVIPDLNSAIAEAGLKDSSHIFFAGVAAGSTGGSYRGTDAGTDTETHADDAGHGLVSSSGRVLLLETTANTVAEARDRIYSLLDSVHTNGLFYRHDIGARALRQQ